MRVNCASVGMLDGVNVVLTIFSVSDLDCSSMDSPAHSQFELADCNNKYVTPSALYNDKKPAIIIILHENLLRFDALTYSC